MKIYLANSLTLATEEFKADMLKLRERLKEGYEVLDYFGLDTGEAVDVFRHDIGQVKESDAILAEVSYPSTGVGIEIMAALGMGKKVLAIAKSQAKVSRMVTGADLSGYKFVRYNSTEDILAELQKFLAK